MLQWEGGNRDLSLPLPAAPPFHVSNVLEDDYQQSTMPVGSMPLHVIPLHPV
jgi:hypothetical protein